MSNGPYMRGECQCGAVALLVTGSALAGDEKSGLIWWRQQDLQLAQGELLERDLGDRTIASCAECGQQVWMIFPGRDDIETPLALWPFD
ncbi:hypothetical protein HCU01_05670 [Halomonas cupida]|uniref:Aldehyde-activating protein n=1 Tax=Halomonas cupida TaxID=44933 RepID=A0A1M6ZWY6_9GAMM|nr:hypothetical protein [Halomonas cupida]GEN22618.1 hypothetical protein HCU01_05670 [Halomonas cupida]SHL34899.1 hypothetical protein SAMN05660971_00274 [Halomonas cupida]